MQFQADIADMAVAVVKGGNLSLRGAAYLEGFGVGILSDTASVSVLREQSAIYRPIAEPQLAKKWFSGWVTALARATLKT